jgi:hypothetical protein
VQPNQPCQTVLSGNKSAQLADSLSIHPLILTPTHQYSGQHIGLHGFIRQKHYRKKINIATCNGNGRNKINVLNINNICIRSTVDLSLELMMIAEYF